MEAFYHGGYAAAAHHHGLPDIGMVGLEEMVESVRRVTLVSTRPVIVDCDTGYGAIAGVKRTVQEMERAGAGAVQIEDQVFPKRCGHMEGKEVIPVDEMVLKIRAAVATRADPETLVIARTDALQPHGLDEAIDRCNAYAEAGADLAFVDAPRSREHLEEIARRVDVPSVANMSETGRTPALSAGELQELGYRIVIFPSTQTWVFARAYEELCQELLAHRHDGRARASASCPSTRSTSSSGSRSSSASTDPGGQPPQMPAVSPPSTVSAVPVTQRASSDAR